MPNPSLWTQCVSYFAGQGHWSVSDKGPFAGADDCTDLLVFETKGADRVCLSRAPQEGRVRLFRTVGESTSDDTFDLSEGSEEDLTSGWVWLHDEWTAAHPSVMLRPATGALGFVLDLDPAVLAGREAAAEQEIDDWLAQGDSLIARLGA